ncbi:hypothetical protein [Xanthomonas citri]|uniref:hypothetical protein n=1 Tax=Xanthomonas citri TaxID=346 RepID=UPI000536635A|nr:hypothetical protein [Xanthomonas citri]KGU41873.1 hypothetical protein NY95_12300 [Xanthomonas citri pv. fuscans]SOO08842.1 hypothetical protein XFF6970_290080 [Xanthomonas citri pv. fuscans]
MLALADCGYAERNAAFPHGLTAAVVNFARVASGLAIDASSTAVDLSVYVDSTVEVLATKRGVLEDFSAFTDNFSVFVARADVNELDCLDESGELRSSFKNLREVARRYMTEMNVKRASIGRDSDLKQHQKLRLNMAYNEFMQSFVKFARSIDHIADVIEMRDAECVEARARKEMEQALWPQYGEQSGAVVALVTGMGRSKSLTAEGALAAFGID